MIKINETVLEQGHFPDGTLLIKIPDIEYNGRVVVFTWLYESDAELFTLMCLVDKYQGFLQHLVMPYIPHARQDRIKNMEDVFTLKTFCKQINALGFETVAVMDPHSDVSAALLDNLMFIDSIGQFKDLHEVMNENDMVFFYPDAGAAKRYGSNSSLPYTYGVKHRNWETGKIESLTVAEPEVVKGKNVMIVDDISSYGGTFARAAAELKNAGAEHIYLAVSHCEKNIFKGSVFTDGNIDRVFTTNSLMQPEDVPEEFADKITIINCF